MSLIEPPKIKTKSDLVKALANSSIELISEHDASDEKALRLVAAEMRSLVRNRKNVHVVLLEKKGGSR